MSIQPPRHSPAAKKISRRTTRSRAVVVAEADDTQEVAAVSRALQVLDAFRTGEEPLGNSELADRTGLPKPTVSRLTYTLTRAGYLDFDSRHRTYELGGAALALGAAALSRRDIRSRAVPMMRSLANERGFNVGLGTRDRLMMIYTDACEGSGLVGLRLYAGSRIPILTSAMGRAYLAAADDAERQSLFEQLRPRHGADWSMLVKTAERSVRDVERNGFCMSLGDWQKDIHGVAAPIRSTGTGRIFTINLGGPAYMLPPKLVDEELGPLVASVARKLETASAK